MIISLLTFALCSAGECADRHFMLIFAHQNDDFRVAPNPKHSHSFGTWVKVDEEDNVREYFTISWVGIYGVLYLHGPMPAENRSLEHSLASAKERCLPVTLWGPYRVNERCYQQAKQQYERLELAERTGQCTYNLFDRQSRHERSFNCIHALSDCCGKTILTGRLRGNDASKFIVEHFHECRLVEGRHPEDDWVWEALRPSWMCVRRACDETNAVTCSP